MLGQPAPLQNTKLPTRGDVAKYIKWLAKNQGTPANRRLPASIFREVTAQVMKIWTDEGIPIHGQKYVIKCVRAKCYRASMKIYRIPKERRESDWRFGKMGNAYFLKLFDIAKCKCLSREQCNCPEGDRIPAKKWAFISDQRGRRRLTRNGVDSAATGAREKFPDGGESQLQLLSSDSTPGPMDIIDIDTDTAASNVVTKEADVSASNVVTKEEDVSASNVVTKEEDVPASNVVTKEEDVSASNVVTKEEDVSASNDVTKEEDVSASNDVTKEAAERSGGARDSRSPRPDDHSAGCESLRLPPELKLEDGSTSPSYAWYVMHLF